MKRHCSKYIDGNRLLGGAVAGVLLVGLCACGDGAAPPSHAATAESARASKGKADADRSGAATEEADKGRRAGRLACAGMSPQEAAKRYAPRAKHAGVSKELAQIVVEPPSAVGRSAGFPRLVGAVYAATVPPALRAAAAAGCAEELASEMGRASSTRAKESTRPAQSGLEQKGNSE